MNTLSFVIGSWVNLMPVACLIALAIAAGAGIRAISPTPLAPNGPCLYRSSTNTGVWN